MTTKKMNRKTLADMHKLKKDINKKIEECGGIKAFAETDFGKELGGIKMRQYLYEKGSTNGQIIDKLLRHFNMGSLTKEVIVTRKVVYFYKEKGE